MSAEGKTEQQKSGDDSGQAPWSQYIIQTENNIQEEKSNGLGIASLIFSLFIGVIGIILGIIGLKKAKKSGRRDVLSLAGIVIGAFQTVTILSWLSFFVAYSSFLFTNHPNVTKKDDLQATISADEIELSELAYDKYMGTGLAVNYPDNWTIDYSPVEISEYGTASSGFNVRSPDGKVDLAFSLFQVTGFGSSCNGSSSSDTTGIYDFGSIEKYPDLGFVSSVNWNVDADNSEYGSYYIGTYGKTGVVSHVGKSIDVTKTGIFDCEDYDGFAWYDVDTNEYGRVFFKIYASVSDYSGPGSVSASTLLFAVPYKSYVDDFMKTDDYKIAKRIIQSLHIEE